MATLAELAAAGDWETYFAQQTAIEHGAQAPMLTTAQREALVRFSADLRRIDPDKGTLFTQHLAVIGDCLRDARRDRDQWERRCAMAVIVATLTTALSIASWLL